jgi:feruloyl esterase
MSRIHLRRVIGIDYSVLDYGSSLNFAAVSADGGHDGFSSGLPFYHHPEIVNDLSYRSVHVGYVIGKQVIQAYYGKAPSKSYYTGCSAGGRQGVQSALRYPGDFDGIIVGSSALDWNHFVGSGGIVTSYVKQSTPSFIPSPLWNVITEEVYKQCDGLDGLMDGIISEPDDCEFNPGTLLCGNGTAEACLTQAQVDGLRKVYQPIYGTKGQLMWPRFDPGAELDRTFQLPMAGQIPLPTSASI